MGSAKEVQIKVSLTLHQLTEAWKDDNTDRGISDRLENFVQFSIINLALTTSIRTRS